MIADNTGNLHLIGQFRYPLGMYHSVKKNGLDWSSPSPFETRPGYENGHYPQAAFSPSSGLHGVWQRKSDSGQAVYAHFDQNGELLKISFTTATEKQD
jgi:hypothetical protein